MCWNFFNTSYPQYNRFGGGEINREEEEEDGELKGGQRRSNGKTQERLERLRRKRGAIMKRCSGFSVFSVLHKRHDGHVCRKKTSICHFICKSQILCDTSLQSSTT